MNNMHSVELLSSMWNNILEEEGGRRKDEPIDTPEFWGDMIHRSAITARFDNTEPATLAVIDRFIERNKRIVLALQAEIVN
jgi:hypothetical protein